jgi:NCS2 family nucleobase:cation symporter-2/xanthine permease XanP
MSQGESSRALRYAVDEPPPHGLAALLGLQTVALILTGIVLIPIIVLTAAGRTGDIEWAVFAALVICGTTTILQARPIGPFGSGYTLYMGTSGAFIAVCTSAAKEGGLPLLATLVLTSSVIQFLFSARLSFFRRIVTPTVGGTVIMLIAVNVFPICADKLASVPEGVDPTSWAAPLTALTTFGVIIAVSIYASGQLRLWAPLFGIVAGCAVASPSGILDLGEFARAPWFGLPEARWPGLDLSFDSRYFGMLPAFLIVTIIGAIETYGDGIAIQRVSRRGNAPVDFKAVQGAVNADGLGNLLAGLAGTLPNTTYATSISVADLTRVAARRVGIYGGIIILCVAMFPKVSALLRAVPDPVAGAYVLVLIVLLFGQGRALLRERPGGVSVVLARSRLPEPDDLP